MSLPRFIQIHTLHNYPAALLNRDDAGLAKRLPYGDAIRTRISSQCLKRHWRVADDRHALSRLGVPMAVRSRHTLDLIRQRIAAQGIGEDTAQWAAEGLRAAGLLDKGKDLKGKEALETGQAVLLGHAEIDHLVRRCVDLARETPEEKPLKAAIAKFLKDEKKNIEEMRLGSGLESALFGRMVTSDLLASRDAAVYVAHAFTVHEAQVENDYFTVVDDLLREAGEHGSAGIFDTELTSGLFYGYVVIDVALLVANLNDDAALAGQVVERLVQLIARTSPGAKKGSTAPYAHAEFLLVETGDDQPRTLANAFRNAVQPRGDVFGRSVLALQDHLANLDRAYGVHTRRQQLSVTPPALDGVDSVGIAVLCTSLRQQIEAA